MPIYDMINVMQEILSCNVLMAINVLTAINALMK